MLIGAQKGLGESNRNLIRSRVVLFADLPGFKVSFMFTERCLRFSCAIVLRRSGRNRFRPDETCVGSGV